MSHKHEELWPSLSVCVCVCVCVCLAVADVHYDAISQSHAWSTM